MSNKFKTSITGPVVVLHVHSNDLSYIISRYSFCPQNKQLSAHYSQLCPWVDILRYLMLNPYFKSMLLVMGEEGDDGEERVSVGILQMLEEGLEEVQEDLFNVPELGEVETNFCGFDITPFSESEYSMFPNLQELQVQVDRVSKPILTAQLSEISKELSDMVEKSFSMSVCSTPSGVTGNSHVGRSRC